MFVLVINMALAKFGLVLAVFFTATHGQMVNQDAMESKHRAVGYRLPPPIYYARQQGPSYGLHHVQRPASNPIGYDLQRPSGPLHQVRPAYAIPHVHHLPAHRIPYPVQKQLPNYANPGPYTGNYPIPLALRPHVTPTTPRPIFPSPAHPTRPPYSPPNHVGPQAQGGPVYRPSPVTPVPTKAPFFSSAPIPPTPKRAPAPSPGRSLLDLPWVKPLYARTQVAPKVNYYGTPSTWWKQEVKPALAVVEQNPGIGISSVGSPLPGTSMKTLSATVVNDSIEVREIPPVATASNVPVPVAVASTQRPITTVIISDDSDEDIRFIQNVATPAPLRQTPVTILNESNKDTVVQQIPVTDRRVSPTSPTPARPASSAVVLDNSDEDIRLERIQQERPVSPIPATVPLSTQSAAISSLILDDSVEDIRIVQQAQINNVPGTSPRPRTTTTTSTASNTVENLVLRDIPREVDLSALSGPSPVAAGPQSSTISLAVSDDSDEEILRQVLVSNVPVSGSRLTPTATPAVSLVVLDNSDEDMDSRGIFQQGSGPLLSALNAGTRPITQSPFISVSISDNSDEDVRIVQGVPAPNVPVFQSTTTRTASLTVRNQGVPVTNVPVSQSTTGTPSLAVRNQGVPVSNVPVSGPRFTPTAPPAVSLVLLDNSDEDVELRGIFQQGGGPLLSRSNPGTMTIAQSPLTSVFVSDNSEEDFRIVQEVPASSFPVSQSTTTGTASLAVRNQGVPMSNVPVSQSTETASLTVRNQGVPVSTPRLTVTGTASLAVLDSSDEQVVLRDIAQEVSRQTSSGPTQIVPLTVFDDSVEDIRIVQQVPVSNVQVPRPSTRPGVSFLELDRSEEDVLLQNTPKDTMSLFSGSTSGTTTRAPTLPFAVLDDSVEDLQIVRQGPLSNGSPLSSLTTIRENSLEVPDNSNEDFELRLIPQPVSVPTISSPGPLLSTTAPLVVLANPTEDIRAVQGIRLPNISSSGRAAETPLLLLRDSGEDIEISRRIPQQPVSLSGSLQSAVAGPVVRLVDSDGDIEIAREIRLLNTSSSGTIGENPLLFLGDSGEDILFSRGIPQPTVSLPGPVQSADAASFVRLVDSDEDRQLTQTVPLSSVLLSTSVTPTAQTPIAFLVDSEEDIQVVQGNSLSNSQLNGSVSTDDRPSVLVLDSAEDTQGFLGTNVSLSSTATTGVVLIDSDEDVQSPVLPLLQATNRVQIQERDQDDDRSDEEIRRRLTISGGSIVFVNPSVP